MSRRTCWLNLLKHQYCGPLDFEMNMNYLGCRADMVGADNAFAGSCRCLEGEGEVDGEAVRFLPSALIGAFLCSFPGADFRPTYISDFGQYCKVPVSYEAECNNNTEQPRFDSELLSSVAKLVEVVGSVRRIRSRMVV